MKIIILIILSFSFYSCSTGSKLVQTSKETSSIRNQTFQEMNVTPASTQPVRNSKELSFTIKKEFDVNQGEIFINMEFKNMSDKSLNLLDLFEPLGIFLTLTISSENGEDIQVLRRGKADFPYNTVFKYIEIPKNNLYKKQINLTSILKNKGIKLPSGKRKLSMAYHNQYGGDCLKGWWDSNEIIF